MRHMFPRPMGDVSRRLHGVIRQLRAREDSARALSHEADAAGRVEFAAAMRGKARGYHEAIDLLKILDHGHPLRRRSRWATAEPTPDAHPASRESEQAAAGAGS